jgi:simple sugar transport system ATP-binding protein
MLDLDTARRRVSELSNQFKLTIDPDARIDQITVGQQQRVEILKALYRRADILILDEPTAVLTPQEAKELFAILRQLVLDGMVSVIFITHKLNEVLEIADRITVVRRGQKIDTAPREGATEQTLAEMMVGREVLLRVDRPPATPGEPLLEVKGIEALDDRELPAVRGVSFQVRAGEIVGIAGVDGNGQSELIEALTGLRRMEAGTVKIGAREFHHATPREMLDAGLGHVPEDRQRRGLVLEFPIAENVALHDYNNAQNSSWGWLHPKRLIEHARRLIKEFDVRGGSPSTRAGALSGGNQQKLVVGREVDRDPAVLIAAQPTRGLDVGAIEYLHRRLVEERDEGRAILLVSLELEEVLALSDRILVIYEGQIVAEHASGVSAEEIGLEMLGGGARTQESAA